MKSKKLVWFVCVFVVVSRLRTFPERERKMSSSPLPQNLLYHGKIAMFLGSLKGRKFCLMSSFLWPSLSIDELVRLLTVTECQDGNLCGVHALNNLLQGPYYSEVDLANIAEELDRRERELLNAQQQQEQTQNQSSNVDETGNFSITVLREGKVCLSVTTLFGDGMLITLMDLSPRLYAAISRSHNIDLDQRNVDTVVADPTQYEGFLLHLQAHWFAIRKIHGYYWNLNSLQPRPSKISEFYLSAFLGQMKEEGKQEKSGIGDQLLPYVLHVSLKMFVQGIRFLLYKEVCLLL